MRTALLALIGLVLGFVFGETLAATLGMVGFSAFGDAPSGPLLLLLRGLPFACALAGAVAAVSVYLRRGPG